MNVEGETEVLAALMAREPIFHKPEFGTSRQEFERMTAPDYWEGGVGAPAGDG